MEEWEKEEIETLITKLEELGGFRISHRPCEYKYDADILGVEMYFIVLWNNKTAFEMTIKGISPLEIYENESTLRSLHNFILNKLKQWKINRAIGEIEKDFEKED